MDLSLLSQQNDTRVIFKLNFVDDMYIKYIYFILWHLILIKFKSVFDVLLNSLLFKYFEKNLLV